jgi:hypothetical protein
MNFIRLSPYSIRLIYALCLAGATVNHAWTTFQHGLSWNYGGLPLIVCTFWTALTFLDPIAISLLLVKPRAGVALTAAIIVADVVVNGWVAANYVLDAGAFAAQVVFLVFVAATVRIAWGRRRSGLDLASGETLTLGFPPSTRRQ